MKINKKGYTLIEIIICIALIVLIGTISLINHKSKEDTLETKKKKFFNSLTLQSAIYYEKNKNEETFTPLQKHGWMYIRLGDLISEGVLAEETFNPFYNKTSKERSNDLVKIYFDTDKNVMVEYPTEFIGFPPPDEEGNDPINNIIEIVLPDEITITLPNSSDMYLNALYMIEAYDNYNDISEVMKDIKKGDLTKLANYSPTLFYDVIDSVKIQKNDSNSEVAFDRSDICITEKTNSTKSGIWNKELNLVYTICEESTLNEDYIIAENYKVDYTVKVKDRSSPTILDPYILSLNGSVEDWENNENIYVNGIIYYNIHDNLTDTHFTLRHGDYVIFDNFDGYGKWNWNNTLINMGLNKNSKKEEIVLKDTSMNSKKYNIILNKEDNFPPTIKYNGENIFYLNMEPRITFNKENNELEPIESNIEYFDIEGDTIYFTNDLLYNGEFVYSKTYNGELSFNNKKIASLEAGSYTLEMCAYNPDINGPSSNQNVWVENIYISDYEYIPIQSSEQTFSCEDDKYCVIGEMIFNTENGLEYLNKEIANRFPGGGIYYDEDVNLWLYVGSKESVYNDFFNTVGGEPFDPNYVPGGNGEGEDPTNITDENEIPGEISEHPGFHPKPLDQLDGCEQ